MKKALAVIAVLAGLYVIRAYVMMHIWTTEAEEYVTESLLAFAQPWNANELDKRASVLLRYNPEIRPQEIISGARKGFGDLIRITSPAICKVTRGHIKRKSIDPMYLKVSEPYAKNTNTFAHCRLVANFEKRDAEMDFDLIDEGNSHGVSKDDWRILIFQFYFEGRRRQT